MRIRFVLCFLAIALCASISAVSAKRLSSGVAKLPIDKTGHITQLSSINKSYRSSGKLHKAVISADNSESLARAIDAGAIQIGDYGSFKLFALDEGALRRSEEIQRAETLSSSRDSELSQSDDNIVVRDDFNLLLLRSGAIDTTDSDSPGTFVGMGRSASEFGLQSALPNNDKISDTPGQLRLVQFIGPVKKSWLQELEASGLEIIAYVPNDGYLVRGDETARTRLQSRNRIAEARGEGFIQWDGLFLDAQKIHPALSEAMNTAQGEITVAVQFAPRSPRNSFAMTAT